MLTRPVQLTTAHPMAHNVTPSTSFFENFPYCSLNTLFTLLKVIINFNMALRVFLPDLLYFLAANWRSPFLGTTPSAKALL